MIGRAQCKTSCVHKRSRCLRIRRNVEAALTKIAHYRQYELSMSQLEANEIKKKVFGSKDRLMKTSYILSVQ